MHNIYLFDQAEQFVICGCRCGEQNQYIHKTRTICNRQILFLLAYAYCTAQAGCERVNGIFSNSLSFGPCPRNESSFFPRSLSVDLTSKCYLLTLYFHFQTTNWWIFFCESAKTIFIVLRNKETQNTDAVQTHLNMDSSSSSSKSDLNLSEPNDLHLFESIDLNADRERLMKMCKINEAAEQADLNRFRHRMQRKNKIPSRSDVDANSTGTAAAVASECQAHIVGYVDGAPTNGTARETGRNGFDTVANGNKAGGSGSSSNGRTTKSTILDTIRINNLSSRPSAAQSAEAKIQAALSSINGAAACANEPNSVSIEPETASAPLPNTTDMEASYAVLTKEEFLASTSSDGSASADNQLPHSQATVTRTPFVRTHKLVDIDKYLKQRQTNSEESVQHLLADAMLETRTPIRFESSFYNISGIFDVNTVESEWRRIDVSPKKTESSPTS